MKTYPLFITSLVLALLLCLSVKMLAQSGGPYRLNWFTIDAGGGISTSDRYSLTGLIAQPDAGHASSEQFIVEGGFFCQLGLPNTNGTLLGIRPAEAGNLEVFWPLTAEGFTLEATADLVAGPWQLAPEPVVDNATEHVVTVPPIDRRFFRLRAAQP